ncbi:MAG: hypothetical protein AB7O98_12190 [Hyphomonadaceae bacterium]
MAASASGQYQDAQAQASLALSQSAASIGIRTPSIQLLRDGMYRLCEAHQNGAIDDRDYQRMLSQYQQMVVGLVAIEQLTGTVTARQSAVNAGGSNASTFQVQVGVLERQLLTLQTWQQRREELRSTIAAIDRVEQTRQSPTAEGATPPAPHPEAANRASFESELRALDTNIPTLMASTQETMRAMAQVGYSAASTTSGSAQFAGANSTTVQETLTNNQVTQRTTTTTPIDAGGAFDSSEAEVIAKAVRDITFEIIRTGENLRDDDQGNIEPAESASADRNRQRRRGFLPWLFGGGQ